MFAEQSVGIVIHLATPYRKINDGDEMAEMLKANISFPIELIESSVHSNVRVLINTGQFLKCDCSHLPRKEDAVVKAFSFMSKQKCCLKKRWSYILLRTQA